MRKSFDVKIIDSVADLTENLRIGRHWPLVLVIAILFQCCFVQFKSELAFVYTIITTLKIIFYFKSMQKGYRNWRSKSSWQPKTLRTLSCLRDLDVFPIWMAIRNFDSRTATSFSFPFCARRFGTYRFGPMPTRPELNLCLWGRRLMWFVNMFMRDIRHRLQLWLVMSKSILSIQSSSTFHLSDEKKRRVSGRLSARSIFCLYLSHW